MIVTRSNVEKGKEVLEHSELLHSNELCHYGRKGMKWYQHIFGDVDLRAKYANAKAQTKRNSLEKKIFTNQKTLDLVKNRDTVGDVETRWNIMSELKIPLKDRDSAKIIDSLIRSDAERVKFELPPDSKPPFKNIEESNRAIKKRVEYEESMREKMRGRSENEYHDQSWRENSLLSVIRSRFGEYDMGRGKGFTKEFQAYIDKRKAFEEEWKKAIDPFSKKLKEAKSAFFEMIGRRDDLVEAYYSEDKNKLSLDKEYRKYEKAVKDARDAFDKVNIPYFNKDREIWGEGAGIVAEGLGYYDTPEARELLKKYVW